MSNTGQLMMELFPGAITVVLSPLAIIIFILLLFSDKVKKNSIFYMFGWVAGLIVNFLIFYFFFLNQKVIVDSKYVIYMIISGILGLLFLYLAYTEWKNHTKPIGNIELPKWMSVIESISPLQSFIIAFLLSTISSQNTIIDLKAVFVVGQASIPSWEKTLLVVFYTIIASLFYVIFASVFVIFGDRLVNPLTKFKSWFIAKSAIILFVLFLILEIQIFF